MSAMLATQAGTLQARVARALPQLRQRLKEAGVGKAAHYFTRDESGSASELREVARYAAPPMQFRRREPSLALGHIEGDVHDILFRMSWSRTGWGLSPSRKQTLTISLFCHPRVSPTHQHWDILVGSSYCHVAPSCRTGLLGEERPAIFEISLRQRPSSNLARLSIAFILSGSIGHVERLALQVHDP
jgi:hypothetical protein